MDTEPLDLSKIEWNYRGEGNSNLVIGLCGKNQIIRIPKIAQNCLEEPSSKTEYIKFIQYLTPHISQFVKPQSILYLNQTTIKNIEEKLEPHRPNHRLAKRLQYGEALLCYDYALLPDSQNEDVYCIEIKPKQGYTPECDKKTLCSYCLHQFYKLSKGLIQKQSDYCPLDLYSGNKQRMQKAINALIANPQNNLKIFKNGNLIYQENQDLDIEFTSEELCDIIIQMLINKCEDNSIVKEEVACQYLPEDHVTLPKGCVLDILYKIQKMNTIGLDKTLALYNNFLEESSENGGKLNIISLQDFKLEQCISDHFIGYLMFSTFRDCSVMLTFQRCSDFSKNTIQVGDKYFKNQASITDLDPKCLSTIKKHWLQQNEALKAHEHLKEQKFIQNKEMK